MPPSLPASAPDSVPAAAPVWSHARRRLSRLLFFCVWSCIRPRMSASMLMASLMKGPLLSMTHSARWAMAASVTSARDGLPVRARVSSTWVAQITGTWAASQSHRISSWTSASRSNPASTARSPRAIMTPTSAHFMSSRRMSGNALKAATVSILSKMSRFLSWPGSRRARRSRTSAALRTKDMLTMSASSRTCSRSAMSCSVRAEMESRESGRLMPFSARSRVPCGAAEVIRAVSSPGPTAVITPPTLPSSNQIRSPARVSARTPASVHPMRWVPTEVLSAGSRLLVRTRLSPRWMSRLSSAAGRSPTLTEGRP